MILVQIQILHNPGELYRAYDAVKHNATLNNMIANEKKRKHISRSGKPNKKR